MPLVHLMLTDCNAITGCEQMASKLLRTISLAGIIIHFIQGRTAKLLDWQHKEVQTIKWWARPVKPFANVNEQTTSISLAQQTDAEIKKGPGVIPHPLNSRCIWDLWTNDQIPFFERTRASHKHCVPYQAIQIGTITTCMITEGLAWSIFNSFQDWVA